MRFTLLLTILISGCGKLPNNGPPMGYVHGVVTYNGKPVEQASVVFVPTTVGTPAAVGITDSGGYYELSISGAKEGAVAGPYQVTIALRAPYDGQIPEGMSPVYAQELFQNQGKPLIPEKYFAAKTSGLTADVKADKRNTFDFALTD